MQDQRRHRDDGANAVASSGPERDAVPMRPKRRRRVIEVGWREWLSLPDLGIPWVKAKIDSGARSSALHVERLEEFERDGAPWVRFELTPTSRRRHRVRKAEAPVVDRREVTDSGGSRAVRLFIRTRIGIAGRSWPIEMNLTDRRSMLFPMLLGRTAMSGHVRIDPRHSFLLGRPSRRVARLESP
jgi:hypothetical protein